jgi:hypothetical protein
VIFSRRKKYRVIFLDDIFLADKYDAVFVSRVFFGDLSPDSSKAFARSREITPSLTFRSVRRKLQTRLSGQKPHVFHQNAALLWCKLMAMGISTQEVC